ncbi:class I SAM-dependent methyltransferase [Belnapia sp. T18]|uniref:Class I SAM-dependent methyltransferase n=1 Tax=Belnapia arida TaxID=2804533 RepID=A0ABS1UCC8_9PROT|nr:class I SAM-dependent methyltransferase [Belnapia arida]
MQPSVVSWYDSNASRLAGAYEAVPPIISRDWLADLLPRPPAVVIDIGAGTGRDAGAFAAAGFEVIAIEPSACMRVQAERLHQVPRIRWLPDSLPTLTTASRSGIAADVVSLNAVWQHVGPADRPRAFRKLVGLLRSGGLLVMTLRHGRDDGRGTHPVSLAEVESLARSHGMQGVRAVPSPDLQGRPEISWTAVVLRLPDDGTGAAALAAPHPHGSQERDLQAGPASGAVPRSRQFCRAGGGGRRRACPAAVGLGRPELAPTLPAPCEDRSAAGARQPARCRRARLRRSWLAGP